VQVKVCLYSDASAPAIIHYLPPTVTSVRHLPYNNDGTDDLRLTGQVGGLPTGGSAYAGFTPAEMDGAIAGADADVVSGGQLRNQDQPRSTKINQDQPRSTKIERLALCFFCAHILTRLYIFLLCSLFLVYSFSFSYTHTLVLLCPLVSSCVLLCPLVSSCVLLCPLVSSCVLLCQVSTLSAKTTAQTTRDAAQTAFDLAVSAHEDCTQPAVAPPTDPVCTSEEAAMTLKEADLAAAETDVYVKGRTYDAALGKKNNLVEAKNTPYTYQYVELLGSNFASEGMEGKFAFAVDFKHSDTLVSGPPPDGLGQRWLLRQKTYGGTVSACNTTDDTPCCPVWTHTRLVCKVPQASGAWLNIVYCFEQLF
jgi:hypothetical protein